MPFTQVGIFPSAHFQLPGVLTAFGIDAGSRQGLDVAVAFRRIDDVNRAVAGGETFTDKGQQHLVELVLGMEKGARMAAAPDLAAGQVDPTIW